jgi:hypothetical protein
MSGCMNRTKQIITIGIAATLSITTLKVDKVEANPITAPACKDVPSCVVTGIVVIGGIAYYVIKNTVTGVERRVPVRKASPPSHRTIEPGRHNVGDKVTLKVSRREQCEERARRYGRETDGGEWVVDSIEVIGRPGIPGRIDPLGNLEEETIQYKCVIRKVR